MGSPFSVRQGNPIAMQCRHHPTCPGCPLLDEPYPAQLEAKRDRLATAFGRYPHLRLPVPGEVTAARFVQGYRHRLKLPVHVGAEHVSAGLYDPASGRVLDTPDCPVLEPGLREALASVLVWLRGRRGVHAIDLRRSSATGELQLVIACEGGDLHGGPRAARKLLASVPGLVSVATSRADPERKRVMGRGARMLAGEPAIEEAIGDVRYQLHPGAFFQVDPRNARWIHDRVRDFVGDAARVLDLYAGVGAYALMLAPGRERVVAVEEVPQAAAAARAMAPDNVEVLASRVEAADLSGGFLDGAPGQPDPQRDEGARGAQRSFDAVILNPARRGSDPETLASVARLAPRLVYVSCGPETLARDLDILAAHGMRVAEVDAIDLFPHTAEVETVVRLQRGKPLVSWRGAQSPWARHQDAKRRRPQRGEAREASLDQGTARARGAQASGARGRPTRVLVLVVGETEPSGTLPGGRFRRLGVVATHSLLRIDLDGPMVPALAALARRRHPVAGRDPRTRRFFAEKAGLLRPFVHVERSASATAPLHGDLVQALIELRASSEVLARASTSPSGSDGERPRRSKRPKGRKRRA